MVPNLLNMHEVLLGHSIPILHHSKLFS